jgi:antitoxin (DNA-binding transcriptional repressor) of toxin-antitoxin stability system
MAVVTIEEAQARLPELIDKLAPGEQLQIVKAGAELAHIVKSPPAGSLKRQLGTLRGTVLYMAPDFDAPPLKISRSICREIARRLPRPHLGRG